MAGTVDTAGRADTADNRSLSPVADTEAAEGRAAAGDKRRMQQKQQQDTSQLNRTYWYLRLAVRRKMKRADVLEVQRKPWGRTPVQVPLLGARRPLESCLLPRT